MRRPFTQINIHLVWSTWDRQPMITGDIEERLYAAMAKRCLGLNCQPVAIGGVEDHVHLLVVMSSAVSVAELVKDVKGASSHLMNHEILPGGGFDWQGAYGAFSVSESDMEPVIEYIKNQKAHHARQELIPRYEKNETTG